MVMIQASCKGPEVFSCKYIVASQKEGPAIRPLHNIILTTWTPQDGTPNFGKPPCREFRVDSFPLQ